MKGGLKNKRMDTLEILVKCKTVMLRHNWGKFLAKEHGGTETLLEHSMLGVGLACTLIKCGFIKDLSDDGTKVLILALAAHDGGKTKEAFQKYLTEVETESVDHSFGEESKEFWEDLCRELDWPPYQEALAAIRLHMKKSDSEAANLNELLNNHYRNDWKQIALMVQDIDHVISANSCVEAMLSWKDSVSLGKITDCTIHSIKLRGVSTVYLHDAIQKVFESKGWLPALFYPNGTFYIAMRDGCTVPDLDCLNHAVVAELKRVIKSQAHLAVELMHGDITATYLVKPELFNLDLLPYLLNYAGKRIRNRSFAEIQDGAVVSYRNIKEIYRVTGDYTLAKKANTKKTENLKATLSQYDQYLIESAQSILPQERERLAARIGYGYQEIAILKMFKCITDPANGIVNEMQQNRLAEKYDARFGTNAYAALKSTSSFMPALDLALVVDNYWNLPYEEAQFPGITIYPGMPLEERKEKLIGWLEEILNSTLKEESGVKGVDLAERMAVVFLQDLEMPRLQPNITETARFDLEANAKAKLTINSEKLVPHICPFCNNGFTAGHKAIEDMVSNVTRFSNRKSAYDSPGVMMCDACYFEYMLQQIVLGGKPDEFICVFPTVKLSETARDGLRQSVETFQRSIETLMDTLNGEGKIYFLNLQLETLIARRINEFNSELSNPETFARIFAWPKSETRKNEESKQFVNALKAEIGELEEVNNFLDSNYQNWTELVAAVVGGIHQDSHTVQDLYRKYYGSSVILKTVFATPNFILFPLRSIKGDSAIGNKDEAEVKVAYKQLLLGCAFAEYLQMSVAIVKRVMDAGILTSKINGSVYIPEHPQLRKAVQRSRRPDLKPELKNSPWLFKTDFKTEESKRWLKALCSAIIVAQQADLPERMGLAQVFNYNHPGEIVRRIEMVNQVDKKVTPEIWGHIKNLKEVLV